MLHYKTELKKFQFNRFQVQLISITEPILQPEKHLSKKINSQSANQPFLSCVLKTFLPPSQKLQGAQK